MGNADNYVANNFPELRAVPGKCKWVMIYTIVPGR